jgi:thiamine pyrophosphate-dependent acetolactate synthase large subunit-like protein
MGRYNIPCNVLLPPRSISLRSFISCRVMEYAILKEFAVLEKTPNVPALDIVSTAKGFGCIATEARTREEIQTAFSKALNTEGPTVIAVPIKHQITRFTHLN